MHCWKDELFTDKKEVQTNTERMLRPYYLKYTASVSSDLPPINPCLLSSSSSISICRIRRFSSKLTTAWSIRSSRIANAGLTNFLPINAAGSEVSFLGDGLNCRACRRYGVSTVMARFMTVVEEDFVDVELLEEVDDLVEVIVLDLEEVAAKLDVIGLEVVLLEIFEEVEGLDVEVALLELDLAVVVRAEVELLVLVVIVELLAIAFELGKLVEALGIEDDEVVVREIGVLLEILLVLIAVEVGSVLLRLDLLLLEIEDVAEDDAKKLLLVDL